MGTARFHSGVSIQETWRCVASSAAIFQRLGRFESTFTGLKCCWAFEVPKARAGFVVHVIFFVLRCLIFHLAKHRNRSRQSRGDPKLPKPESQSKQTDPRFRTFGEMVFSYLDASDLPSRLESQGPLPPLELLCTSRSIVFVNTVPRRMKLWGRRTGQKPRGP